MSGGRKRPRPVRVRSTRREKLKVALAIAIPLALTAGVATAIALNSGGSGGSSAASATTTTTLSKKQSAEQKQTQDFQAQINKDFSGAANDLIQLIKQTQAWRSGTATPAQITSLIDANLPDFVAARDTLAKEAPFPLARQAVGNYHSASQLYLEAIRVERVAATVPTGPEQTQLDLSFRRLRELGDRVYDQGTRALDPTLHQPSSPDVQVEKPPDVPDWVAEGLAAGPPLDAQPPPATNPPAQYQQNRPQQSMSGWVRAVRKLDIPSAGELMSSINSPDNTRLQHLANRFANAAHSLDKVADPKGQRAESTTLRLGLLIDAESARVAQAATLVTDPVEAARLNDGARRLSLIGDSFWPAALGARHSGFNPDLLNQTGP